MDDVGLFNPLGMIGSGYKNCVEGTSTVAPKGFVGCVCGITGYQVIHDTHQEYRGRHE